MKKHFLILSLLGLGFFSLKGQKLHTPTEIYKIMENSNISYELNILDKKISPPDRTNNLNYNTFYRISSEGRIATFKYKTDGELDDYLAKAENYFVGGKYSLAREMYLEALNVDSTYYAAMTFIGQTYGIEGDLDKAIEWYKKTIGLNYIDYLAHWFLADIYKTKGEVNKAVDEITIAMILNRNNPRIKKSYNSIYELKKLKTDDWSFIPQMEIDSIEENKVRISFDADWFGYAIVKALWRYEPGYKKSMGVSEGTFSTTEEKEGFLALMTTFDKKKLKRHPEFRALQAALDKKMINEFILYEVVLPEHPFAAYQLSEEFINTIKDYVIEIRGKQK